MGAPPCMFYWNYPKFEDSGNFPVLRWGVSQHPPFCFAFARCADVQTTRDLWSNGGKARNLQVPGGMFRSVDEEKRWTCWNSLGPMDVLMSNWRNSQVEFFTNHILISFFPNYFRFLFFFFCHARVDAAVQQTVVSRSLFTVIPSLRQLTDGCWGRWNSRKPMSKTLKSSIFTLWWTNIAMENHHF